MTYYFKYCDEPKRVLQAVVLDRPEKNLKAGFDGNTARSFLDNLYKSLPKCAVYKVETSVGVLSAAFLIEQDSSFVLFTRAAFNEAEIMQQVKKFVSSGLWKLDVLS